jgi:hypothetical protein
VWINTWFTRTRVGLKCRVRHRIADLIHLVSVPRLIKFVVDNFYIVWFPAVYACSFLCGHYYVHNVFDSSKLVLVVNNMHSICRLWIAVPYVPNVLYCDIHSTKFVLISLSLSLSLTFKAPIKVYFPYSRISKLATYEGRPKCRLFGQNI